MLHRHSCKAQSNKQISQIIARADKTVSLDDDNIGEIESENDTQSEMEKIALCYLMIEKITELGEPDSTIIIQKYYYNRSSGEIAKLLSMKASAVRMRCGRAMKKLRKMLEGFDITL